MTQRLLLVFLFLAVLGVPAGGNAAEGAPAQTHAGETHRPVLSVSPREIDFGAIGPGEGTRAVYILRNLGSGPLQWSIADPEGWSTFDRRRLSGTLETVPAELNLHLSSLTDIVETPEKTGKVFPFQLTLEQGGDSITLRKDFPVGAHRQSIRLSSDGGSRTVFFSFRVAGEESLPVLDVQPVRVDFGVVAPGKYSSRRIRLSNKGRETLKWIAAVPAAQSQAAPRPPGRYVSFRSEESRGKAAYSPPAHLRDSLQLSGGWKEEDGYPVASGENPILRYRFDGTGILLHFIRLSGGGNLVLYIDDRWVTELDGAANRKEEGDFAVAADLPDGAHVLTVAAKAGRIAVEGVRIFGRETQKGPPGWIGVVPNQGKTTRENDYVSIVLNAQSMRPGIYADSIRFSSNGGEAAVEVSVEVAADTAPKLFDVYRFNIGSDYLYTSNPQAEAARISAKRYRKDGLAFQLFPPGTPGTTDFHRWYHPGRGDHFYAHDLAGGGKSLQGYLYEGSIGAIATSKISGTRELYRWFNPGTSTHFYTTDPSGEGASKRGYRFEGIAGFVR
jgi:hypothetical protein